VDDGSWGRLRCPDPFSIQHLIVGGTANRARMAMSLVGVPFLFSAWLLMEPIGVYVEPCVCPVGMGYWSFFISPFSAAQAAICVLAL
jgi:hypothetical protein